MIVPSDRRRVVERATPSAPANETGVATAGS